MRAFARPFPYARSHPILCAHTSEGCKLPGETPPPRQTSPLHGAPCSALGAGHRARGLFPHASLSALKANGQAAGKSPVDLIMYRGDET